MKLRRAKTMGLALLVGLLLVGESGFLRTWNEGLFCTRCFASKNIFNLFCGSVRLWQWRTTRGTRCSEAYQRLWGPCHPHAFAPGSAGGSSGLLIVTRSEGGSGELSYHAGRKQVINAMLDAAEARVPSHDLGRKTWELLNRLSPPDSGREVLEAQGPKLLRLAESLDTVRSEEAWKKILEDYASGT